MAQSFTADDFAETKTGNSLTFTPEDFSTPQFTEADFAPQATPVQPGDINPEANKVPDLQATTRGGPPAPVASLGETLGSLGQELQMTRAPGEEPFTGILPRPTGKIGALLRSGSGPEKAIAGAAVGTAELIEGVANYMSSPQGIVELGLTKTPVAPVVFLKWAKDMVEGGMISVSEAFDAFKRGDMESFGKHVVTGAGMLFGAGGIVGKGVQKAGAIAEGMTPRGQGIASPELKALAPQTAAVVEQTTTGEPNAISQPTATEVGIRSEGEGVGGSPPLRQQGKAPETLTAQTEAALKETQAIVQPENIQTRDVVLPSSAKPNEVVTAAAVKINGELFEGTDHADAIGKFIKKTGFPEDEVWSEKHGEIESGFVTSTGRFVDLEEASALAGKKPGTVSHAAEIITSPKSKEAVSAPEPLKTETPTPPVSSNVTYELLKSLDDATAKGDQIAAHTLKRVIETRPDAERDAAVMQRLSESQAKSNLGGSIESKSAAEQARHVANTRAMEDAMRKELEAMGVEVPKAESVSPPPEGRVKARETSAGEAGTSEGMETKQPWNVSPGESWSDFLDNVIAGKYAKETAIKELMDRESTTEFYATKHWEALTHPKRGQAAWMLTKKEYAESEFVPKTPFNRGGYNKEVAEMDHESYVEEAIRDGKPVPPEVLKDYPDLQPPPPRPAEAIGKPPELLTPEEWNEKKRLYSEAQGPRLKKAVDAFDALAKKPNDPSLQAAAAEIVKSDPYAARLAWTVASGLKHVERWGVTGPSNITRNAKARKVKDFIASQPGFIKENEMLFLQGDQKRFLENESTLLLDPKGQPQLNAASVESLGVKLPAGYVREGDRYVFKSESKPTPPASQGAEGGTAGAIATPGPPLAPAAAGSVSLPPKSQRQIITDIAKGLKLPVRFGRLTTTKFAGYFKSVANLIGSKRADDIPIVSHEAGHKLDKTFSLSSDASLKPELDILGDPATPGSRSSWTKSKTKKYKMGEGVAEFVRYWLTDPAHAQKVAPNTFTAFERALDSNKDFGDTMRQAQSDIAVWRNADPQARLRSQISIGENPNKTPYTLSQLTRDLVDDLHVIRLAVLDAAPKGSALPPSLDPYLLARNLRGSYGMAATFIRDGVVDFKTKAVRMGTSLEDALKPVAGRLNDFRDWIVAKQAKELHSQGKESGFVPSDVDAVVRKFDGDADFQKAFADVKQWQDALLQYAEDSGLLTKDSVAAMRKMNQDFVPFHRVFEVGAGESPSQQAGGIGMGLNVGKPGSLKGRKGSPRQIVDPFETMVKNAYTIITASEKAAINTAVADLSKLPDMGKWVERVSAPKERVEVELGKIREDLERNGVDTTGLPDDLLLSFFRQSRAAPFGENIIRINRDGKSEFYRLNRDLHDTFKALDLEDSGKLLRMFAAPAQLLRAGVVLEPSFNIANMLRDTFSAAVIGKYGALPFETTMRGVAAMVKDPKLVSEWAASGGKSAVEASYFDRAKLQKFLSERITKDLTPAERALIVARSPLSALRWLTSAFEEATRIGEYKTAFDQLTKSGMPEGEARRLAAFEARDRQDFAKGGAKTKIIRHAAAFWNAGLQANVKLAQAFKERPLRTTLQGLAFITIPKLLEQAINWDDDDYWARKQWERDLFFLIPIGKDKTGHTQFLRLPTPFEVGVIFGTFPGRILQGLREKDPDAMKSFPSLFLKQSVPNPVPQAYQVVFEDFLSGKKGWDVWRGRTIVPESLADEPPEMQWTEQTSGVAKKAGEVLKFSPMKIDHLIERTTGGMGKLVTGRSVPGQRFVTAPLTVSNQATETFYDRLESLREDAARAKAAGKAMPAEYAAFQATDRRLAELRKLARETKDLDRKASLQEQALKLTTEILKRYPDRK